MPGTHMSQASTRVRRQVHCEAVSEICHTLRMSCKVVCQTGSWVCRESDFNYCCGVWG